MDFHQGGEGVIKLYSDLHTPCLKRKEPLTAPWAPTRESPIKLGSDLRTPCLKRKEPLIVPWAPTKESLIKLYSDLARLKKKGQPYGLPPENP